MLLNVSKIKLPVISVGNITAGGTGKTPMVHFLAKELINQYHKIAILSRGYGRKSSGYKVVSDGVSTLSNHLDSGDEPFLLSKLLKNCIVVVDENRIRGIKIRIPGAGASNSGTPTVDSDTGRIIYPTNYIFNGTMGAAVWSGSRKEIANFPAKMFLKFFDNHGILDLNNAPQWHTVVGGSYTYVQKILDDFNGEIIKGNGVKTVLRKEEGVVVSLDNGEKLSFDKVVCATHADQTYRMIKDMTEQEVKILQPWEYSKNKTILHTDVSVMPPSKSAWACWNYVKNRNSEDQDDVSVTYYMNRLQGLNTKNDYLVTLNPNRDIPQNKIIYETEYTHPKYTHQSLSTQEDIIKINGSNNLYFCGSYCRYGFHEDAVLSAVRVAEKLGCVL